MNDRYDLYIAWAEWLGGNRFSLGIQKLSAWSPVVELLTPNPQNNQGQVMFQFEWRDFDPDSNATIRLARLDPGQRQEIYFDGNTAEDVGAHDRGAGNGLGECQMR